MGALEMGLSEEELQPLVTAWRDSNPMIMQFWWDVDYAVKECVKKRIPTETHGVRFAYQSGMPVSYTHLDRSPLKKIRWWKTQIVMKGTEE